MLTILYLKIFKYLVELAFLVSAVSFAVFILQYFFIHEDASKIAVKKGLVYDVLILIFLGSLLVFFGSVVFRL